MNVSNILNKFEKSEIIYRKTSTKDTRDKAIFLTNRGKELSNKSLNIVESIDQQFFGVLSNEKYKFNKMLMDIIKTINQK